MTENDHSWLQEDGSCRKTTSLRSIELRRGRQVMGHSGEQIIFHLSQGDIWMVTDHPNQEKFPNQRIYFVVVENYVYMVPHIIQKDFIFLKTIIPSRKATKAFLKKQEG